MIKKTNLRQPISIQNFPEDGIVYSKNDDRAIILCGKPYTQKSIKYRVEQNLWYVPTKRDKQLLQKRLKEAEQFYNRPSCSG